MGLQTTRKLLDLYLLCLVIIDLAGVFKSLIHKKIWGSVGEEEETEFDCWVGGESVEGNFLLSKFKVI